MNKTNINQPAPKKRGRPKKMTPKEKIEYKRENTLPHLAHIPGYFENLRLMEMIIDDIIKGKTRRDILFKVQKGEYEDFKHSADWSIQWQYKKIAEAFDMLKEDNIKNRDEQINVIYNQYMKIYEESMSNKDRANARMTLDSLSKLLGLNEPDKVNVDSNFEIKIDFKLDDIITDNNDGEEED